MNARFHSRPRDAAGGQAGLARALSKLGFCSRSRARALIQSGHVRVGGVVCRDPQRLVNLEQDLIEVDGQPIRGEAKVYLMLNKPRGLVTTALDEHGRPTVFQCLTGKGLPFVAPVGRLDKASEGLLLMTNDTDWAAAVAAPKGHLDKTYHVQVDCLPDEMLIKHLEEGIRAQGDLVAAKRASVLRHGEKNSWLEIVLDEGKNRHIRRLLAALEIYVLRLVRVSIGPLPLGNLAKGEFRRLTPREVAALTARNRGLLLLETFLVHFPNDGDTVGQGDHD